MEADTSVDFNVGAIRVLHSVAEKGDTEAVSLVCASIQNGVVDPIALRVESGLKIRPSPLRRGCEKQSPETVRFNPSKNYICNCCPYSIANS